jgi:hypothetical protein
MVLMKAIAITGIWLSGLVVVIAITGWGGVAV